MSKNHRAVVDVGVEDRLIDVLSILTGGYNNGYPANPSIRAEVFAQDSGNSIHLAGSGPDGSYIQGYEEKSPPTAGRVRLSPQGTLFINQKNDVFVSFPTLAVVITAVEARFIDSDFFSS